MSSGMSALFILLAVGALIGTWNMAGTIPTVVYYGLGLLSATLVLPGDGARLRRSSGSPSAAPGRPRRRSASPSSALAPLVGADPAIAAGAVISRRLLRRQDDAASRRRRSSCRSMVGGVTTNAAHRRDGLDVRAGGGDRARRLHDPRPDDAGDGTPAFDHGQRAGDVLAGEFSICLLNLLPLVLLVIFSVRRVPPFLAIFSCALFAGVLALLHAAGRSWRRSSTSRARAPLLTGIEAIYAAMANGFVSDTGNETIDALFSRGGMAGMLTTIWLDPRRAELRRDHGGGGLPRSADQADRRPREVDRPAHRGRHRHVHRPEHHRRRPVRGDRHAEPGLSRRVRPPRDRAADAVARGRGLRHGHVTARAVEQLRRLHGAALGVATIAYLPFCFFNLASPIISLLYGFTGFRIEHVQPTGEPPASTTGVPSTESQVLEGGPA